MAEDEPVLQSIKVVLDGLAKAKADLTAANAALKKLNLVNETRTKELAKDKSISGWAAINDRARKSNKEADYNTYKEKAEAKKKKAGPKKQVRRGGGAKERTRRYVRA